MQDVTCILCDIEQGDVQAAEQLLPLVWSTRKCAGSQPRSSHSRSRDRPCRP